MVLDQAKLYANYGVKRTFNEMIATHQDNIGAAAPVYGDGEKKETKIHLNTRAKISKRPKLEIA